MLATTFRDVSEKKNLVSLHANLLGDFDVGFFVLFRPHFGVEVTLNVLKKNPTLHTHSKLSQ